MEMSMLYLSWSIRHQLALTLNSIAMITVGSPRSSREFIPRLTCIIGRQMVSMVAGDGRILWRMDRQSDDSRLIFLDGSSAIVTD